jgi:flagellar biosynthesis/type III secretory pathway chaperone
LLAFRTSLAIKEKKMVTASVDIFLQQDLISSFEELMVKQFRALQDFVTISRRERLILTKGDSKALVILVDEKEKSLEHLSIMEDSLHMVMEEIYKNLGLDSKKMNIAEILTHIDSPTAEKINRLRDGIISLSDEARDLNLTNRALAMTNLQWLDSAQKIMLEFYSAPETYNAFGRKPAESTIFIRELDRKA